MLRENARQSYEKKWITIRKFWNIFNSFEVDHPKKISHHKKCSFNKPAVRVPPKVKKNITQESKIDKTKVGAKSENVDLDTQNPAWEKLLHFSGKTQPISVPRRKKLAKFMMVSKEPSFFKVLPLTHVTHYKLPFRSFFLSKIREVFVYCPKNPEKKCFFKKLVFPQNFTLVAPNAVLQIWPEVFRKEGSNSIT